MKNNRFTRVKLLKKEGYLPLILEKEKLELIDVKRIFTNSEIVYKIKNYQFSLVNGSPFLKQDEVEDVEGQSLLRNR